MNKENKKSLHEEIIDRDLINAELSEDDLEQVAGGRKTVGGVDEGAVRRPRACRSMVENKVVRV